MSATKSSPLHPGAYVKQNIIPAGVSVTEAAKLLGVGRPALSNFLNAKAALSCEMAARLEKAFGANKNDLLKMQTVFDLHTKNDNSKEAAVRAYVPSFLTITAHQIESWAVTNHGASTIEARSQLSVLLRTLVNSSGIKLESVDFPGYDNSQRKGWDGFVITDECAPWIPRGKSGWEFGCDKNVPKKAEDDYTDRLKSIPSAEERSEYSFVFVTPRNWPGKTAWAKSKNAEKKWKSVHAFDASDLEQWVEQSISGQVWLAKKLNLPHDGFETLESCWQSWSFSSEPPMTPKIFSSAITVHTKDFRDWLNSAPDRPLIVTADSKDEALAFISCLFQEREFIGKSDLAAIFHSPTALRKLALSTSSFIPIVYTDEAERELAPFYRKVHCITIRPRNTVDSEPNIALDLISDEAFEKSLIDMGFERSDIEGLARRSGRSPTILRRQLSKIEAIRRPAWINTGKAQNLIPMIFVGTWHISSPADIEVLSTLAGDCSYENIESNLAELLQLDDSPVWSVGKYRGVTSKIDALFAVSASIIKKNLEDFLIVAEYVLSEIDPALELPEDKRWAADLYGKSRNHSAALRKGICDTLIILAVHGNNLFLDRLGFNAEEEVSKLIRRLLTPLTTEKLLSYDNDLMFCAEAAPNHFLDIVEKDLKEEKPVLFSVLNPVDSGIFGGCPRSGLLWALECLAWSPQNLSRVTLILAHLSTKRIDDNWRNKPESSLQDIYRSWMPQTAASLEERKKGLELLVKRFPDIGWRICIDQFELHTRVGHYTHKPLWRNDAANGGKVITKGEAWEFSRKALDLTINWLNHDENTLGDLVVRLQGMPNEDQAKIWHIIDQWAENKEISDKAKAVLRERIRRFALTRRGRTRKLQQSLIQKASNVYNKLASQNPVIRHSWLFTDAWIEFSFNELGEGNFNSEEREKRVCEERIAAIGEIWEQCGFDGIVSLLEDSGAPAIIGQCIAKYLNDSAASLDFLSKCLALRGEAERKVKACIQGFLYTLDSNSCISTLEKLISHIQKDQLIQLFKCAPFNESTWNLLNMLGKDIQAQYWSEVLPIWNRHTDDELIQIIDRLLEANRPHAAFQTVRLDWEKVETSRLKRLLQGVATSTSESEKGCQLSSYDIAAALKSLSERTGVTTDELAQLEFLFIKALDNNEYGIPNLERQISESPALFVQAVALTYKRDDEGIDPPEWVIDDPQHRSAVASATYSLLERVARIPGSDDAGIVNTDKLHNWLKETRQLLESYSRKTIGDQRIGQLLARASKSDNEIWPCIPICEALERIASPDIATGFCIGVFNARGGYFRSEGGEQERQIAAQYRQWSNQLLFEFPYVAGILADIAVSYDKEARWEDSEAKIRKRLNY